MKRYLFATIISIITIFTGILTGCNGNDSEPVVPTGLSVSAPIFNRNNVSFEIETTNATKCSYTYFRKSDGSADGWTVDKLLMQGIGLMCNTKVTLQLKGLSNATDYILIVAATNSSSALERYVVEFTAGCDHDHLDVSDPVVTANKIKFDVMTRETEACSYVCFKRNAADSAAWTVDKILAQGTKVAVNTTVTVDVEGLDFNSDFTLMVASRQYNGNTNITAKNFTVYDKYTHLGAPALTYIVPSAGDFMFDPKLSSGAEIAGIATADWIWATKQTQDDTDQQIIKDVKYENGRICFTATGLKGNAAVAAFNADKTSLCVWLIWCTDQPGDMLFASGATFMDRAIGATSANPADGDKTVGAIVYQWGRPVPFFGGYADEWDSEGQTFEQARLWTVMNPAYNYKWTVAKSAVDMAGSWANPTTFYVGFKGSCMWFSGTNNLSMWGETKTDYDPSPAGWRLSNGKDWGKMHANLTPAAGNEGSTYTYNNKTAWIPPKSMGRDSETGEYIVGARPGTMYWNGKLYADSLLFNMGLRPAPTFYPSRCIIQHTPGMVPNVPEASADASAAYNVRCVKL